MDGDVDLFEVYRWLVALVCTVYATVCTVQSVWRWLVYFGQTRETKVLGHYAGALLLRARVQRHVWELGQIVVLVAVLGYVVYLHGVFDNAK